MQVSRIEANFISPSAGIILQNGTPHGRGLKFVNQVTESIEEAAAAPAYVQDTIPRIRSTPIRKESNTKRFKCSHLTYSRTPFTI